MKRLSLVILFCTTLSAFAFSQIDCRLQDSLTLTNFHHRIHFKSAFEWNLDEPMDTWYGVTLSDAGCVERLELSGTSTGSYCCLPDFSTMSELTYVDLSDNSLRYLPDMKNTPQLSYINVTNNRHNFYALRSWLPLSGVQTVYAPQAAIDEPTESRIFTNANYTIYVPYSTQNGDVFTWYKDGVQISTTSTNDLELADIQPSDAGAYTLDITNADFPDLTLQTGPYSLSVGGVRERDSLVLADFYESVEFKHEAQEWDLSQPMDAWYGVTLTQEGCVERLELPDALSNGSLPYLNQSSNLTCLTHLDLSNNGLPTMTNIAEIPNLNYLNVQGNALQMTHLMPFTMNMPATFIYHPQNLTLSTFPDEIVDMAGTDQSIRVSTNVYQTSGNVFKWYRNGTEVIGSVDNPNFRLHNLQTGDSGTYICEVTNPALPDLTLYGDSMEVTIMPDGRALDSLILTLFDEAATFKPGHGWDLTQPMNTWEGVTLNAEGRVKDLVLPNTLTQGEIIPRMNQLDDLEVIDLSHNNLTGGFLGNVSANYYSLFPKLRHADLSHNQLTGCIQFLTLMQPGTLEYLDYNNNQISCIMSAGVSTGLTYYDVSDNDLNYSYQYSIPASPDLEVLRLNGNALLGDFSDEQSIGLEQLRVAELQNNNIADLYTDFFNPSVDSLNVAHNQLTFEDLIRPDTPDTYIYAPQDSIGNELLVNITPGSDYTIYLEFDENVENNTYTWYRDGNLVTTTTEGVLPLTNLQTADTGDYTCQVTNPALSDLTLHTTPVTILVDEQYNNCRLRDSLALVQIVAAEAYGSPHWDLSQPMENWHGVVLSEEGCVLEVGFSDDEMTYISPAIGQLLDVEEIWYDENLLSDSKIPHSIGNLTNLRVFGISDDCIDGPIPVELTTLPNLETLSISCYTGEIPPEIGNLTALKSLRLGSQSTEIPPEIGNLVNLEFLWLYSNLETLPSEMSNMTNLKHVRFSHNQLNDIPSNLAENWTNLIEIELGYNYLTYDDLIQFQDFNFGYQNTIGTPETVELTIGDDFIIDLGFDENVTDNTYHWFHNSTPIDTTTQNTLVLENVQLDDVGIYTCQVYNATLSNYVLNTAPITLIVGGNAPESPVYPGDANADGIVSGTDILFWGLAEGNTGEIRPDASVVWTPQPTPDWNNTVADINGKHQDTDGSGLVDEADLDIIEVNYLKTNADYQQQFYQDDALQITPQIAQAQNFGTSSEYEVEINLGSNAQGTTSIHGLSFSVDFSDLNSAESYTAELTNTDSWLQPSNVVSIHDDYAERSDFALTCSDLQDKTGIGSVGTLSIITENLPSSDVPQFRAVIRDITAIQSDGTLLRGEDVFIGSFSNGSAEGVIPAIEFEAIAYAATCEQPSSATVTVTSGTPPYQYQWSNGGSEATAENLPPGEYEVIVTDDFGQTLVGVVIVPNGTPLPNIELQTNADGQIELVSDLPDVQYEWNGSPAGSTTSLTPGQHTLTVSNAANCSKTVSVWVSDIYSNVILEGAYDTASGLMNDNLRQLGLIPLIDPYTGRMTTTDAVLQTTGNSAIVDWVLVELHDKDTPGKVISSYPALLRRDGFIISNDGDNPPRIAVSEETDYYLVVKHRNHLPVKSSTVVSLAQGTTGQLFEQGNASLQKQMTDGIHAAFAGDIATDHTIDGGDKVMWEPMNGTFYQYNPADTNLDGDINGADKGVWFENNGTFTDIE